ncbi:MAG: hypothetical protein C4291_10510 [Candidatus Dadabacteria bacterium]
MKLEKCRFCEAPVPEGSFRDRHIDGKIACFECYMRLNNTQAEREKYRTLYHYCKRFTAPWSGKAHDGKGRTR